MLLKKTTPSKEFFQNILDWAKQKSNFYNCKILWISEQRYKQLTNECVYTQIYKALGVHEIVEIPGFMLTYTPKGTILICYKKAVREFISSMCSEEDIEKYLQFAFLHEIAHIKFEEADDSLKGENIANNFAKSFFSEEENKIIDNVFAKVNRDLYSYLREIVENREIDELINTIKKIDNSIDL